MTENRKEHESTTMSAIVHIFFIHSQYNLIFYITFILKLKKKLAQNAVV